MKRVLDVGQCRPDHGAIRYLLETQFGAEVTQAHDATETMAKLRSVPFDLVLINRKLDADYSDGFDILQQIKADPKLAAIPVMLVTNYPEYQEQAVAAGAEPGFGKSEYSKPETHERLKKILG